MASGPSSYGRVGRQDVMHLHIHVLGGPDPFGRMLPRS